MNIFSLKNCGFITKLAYEYEKGAIYSFWKKKLIDFFSNKPTQDCASFIE